MKMKKLGISIITLCIFMLLSACSKTTAPAGNESNSNVIPQAPARTAEVYGKVKSVLGNEVTLQLAELPPNQELTAQDKQKKQAQMQSLSPEEKQKQIDAQTKYTGENSTIIIPVGTPIVSGNTPEIMKEKSLTDIRSGILLRIWLEGGKDEVKAAEYVRLLQTQ